MSAKRTILLVAVTAAPLLASATAEVRVSHGISGILVIDTVTAVNGDASAFPPATIPGA
jgi:hypothetical protein